MRSQSTVVAYPCCGLANKMRTVIGAALHSPQDQPPTIVWTSSPISGAPYDKLFEPHEAFRVIDDKRWRSDDFDSRCQEAFTCVRWRSEGEGGRRLEAGPSASSSRHEAKRERKKDTTTRTCNSLAKPLGYATVLAAAGLEFTTLETAPTLFRGCGMRFEDPVRDPPACANIAARLRPLAPLRALVQRLLPNDPHQSFGVHLRAPDVEMDIGGSGLANASRGGRRLAQGSSQCHPIGLYAKMVGAALLAHKRVTTVYVASGALSHLQAFREALHAELAKSERAFPRIVSLSDVLALDGAPTIVPRPASEGPYKGGGRDTVFGVQGAVLDLWALASTSKLFRTGESTFGMLAAAMHRQPEELVVHDGPGCRTWSQMFAVNGTPAFCAARRGLEGPKTCTCAA